MKRKLNKTLVIKTLAENHFTPSVVLPFLMKPLVTQRQSYHCWQHFHRHDKQRWWKGRKDGGNVEKLTEQSKGRVVDDYVI